MEGLRDALTNIYEQLTAFAVDSAPRLLTAVAVLLVGLLIAKTVEKIVRVALSRVKFDALMDRIGMSQILATLGVRGSLTGILARLAYYVLVILFVQGAANAVGLAVISEAIASFLAYLPRLVAAVLIVLLGNLVANFASTAVSESAKESGVDYGPALGRAVAGGILFIVVIMAIAQLGVDTAMIRIVVIAALAGTASAFALSFGLGTRDVTRNIVAGFYARKLYRIGETLEVVDEKGTLSAITPTKTILEQDGRTIAIANSQLLDRTVRQ